jgi:predicted phosphodiesterase
MDILSNPLPQDPAVLRKTVMEGLVNLKRQEKQLDVDGRLIKIPPLGKVIILGDLHGDLDSLKIILEETKLMEELEEGRNIKLICLGDYIDRGPAQIEVLNILLNLLYRYPKNIHLLRGNHEGPKDLWPSPHDFPERLRYHYGETGNQLYQVFRRLFDNLYTAVYIQGKALLLHGGIPSGADSLREIAFAHENHPEKGHLGEILWSDPTHIQGVLPNPRGAGKLFGPNIAEDFLTKINANLLIRGHQYASEGYRIEGPIVTLFSCKIPHYGNEKAAYLDLELDKPINRDIISWFIKTF